MEDNQEIQDFNLDENFELDNNEDDGEEVVTISKDEFAKLQKRSKAVGQLTKRLNDLKGQPQKPIIKQEESRSNSIDMDEALELRLDGYSKDEVKFIQSNGGRAVLEDPTSFVSIALNTKREQKRAEDAAGKVVDTSSLSEVERKYTPEQLENMPLDELYKVLPKAD